MDPYSQCCGSGSFTLPLTFLLYRTKNVPNPFIQIKLQAFASGSACSCSTLFSRREGEPGARKGEQPVHLRAEQPVHLRAEQQPPALLRVLLLGERLQPQCIPGGFGTVIFFCVRHNSRKIEHFIPFYAGNRLFRFPIRNLCSEKMNVANAGHGESPESVDLIKYSNSTGGYII